METIVSNTGPIIALAGIHKLNLLQNFYKLKENFTSSVLSAG